MRPDTTTTEVLSAPEVAGFEAVPVPPSDGPKLAPLALEVPVFDTPSRRGVSVGYLRIGARPARSEAPVSREDCPGGWYALRPVGFVCAEGTATTDLAHPLARAIQAAPDRTKPMPYAYAFVRAVAPNYLRVPDKKEQFEKEMRLERHLRNWKRFADEWDKLDVGANDVPLDESGLGADVIPETAIPLGMSERYGGDGTDEVPWWLADGKRLIPHLSTFQAPAYAIIAGRVKRHAGVALIDSFVADERAQGRRFAISVDARLLPADKLKADSGSPFHGRSIAELGLPVGFARKAGARWWSEQGGELKAGEPLGWREFVALSGKSKQIQGTMMVEARDGRWLKSDDLKTAKKPSKLPWYATGARRWIQVSITGQTLVLWEGNRPVYATLVSTGRDGLGDPKTTLSTPQGVFKIYEKHVTRTMDSSVADNEFELRDVPWVQYFKGGYAIHAAYWHDDFGRPRSHGCINLAPIDARYVFLWTSPDVPDQWHGSNAGETFDEGTLVDIGP